MCVCVRGACVGGGDVDGDGVIVVAMVKVIVLVSDDDVLYTHLRCLVTHR